MAGKVKSDAELTGVSDCPDYATCEKIDRICSHEIPACMAIKMSEDVCLNCKKERSRSRTGTDR